MVCTSLTGGSPTRESRPAFNASRIICSEMVLKRNRSSKPLIVTEPGMAARKPAMVASGGISELDALTMAEPALRPASAPWAWMGSSSS